MRNDTYETVANAVAKVAYMCIDCKVMLDLSEFEIENGIIVSPYTNTEGIINKTRITYISKLFLEKLVVRNNYQNVYQKLREETDKHTTLLQKAYFSMLCAAWCSEKGDASRRNFTKIKFFIRETKLYIIYYMTDIVRQIIAQPTYENLFDRIFKAIDINIITPLFISGTFGAGEFDEGSIHDPSILIIYDFWIEELTRLKHSLKNYSFEPEIVEERLKNQMCSIRNKARPHAAERFNGYQNGWSVSDELFESACTSFA